MPGNGVVGTDGNVPISNPSGRWTTWELSEIFLGQAGLNKYVPKVKDHVVDVTDFSTYKVTSVDPVTLIPTLVKQIPSNALSTFDDILLGTGPGTQSDTYRVYVDANVSPANVAVDARLKVAGTMCDYARIFKGANLTGTGTIISQMYNSSGVFIDNKVPLELVAVDNVTNTSIKTVPVCKTTVPLVDGEIVTAVFYDAAGNVVSKRQLLVENTSFIRSVNSSQKFIVGISLESPFMSPTLTKTIEYPLNVPIGALGLIGVVHYSDGSTIKLPVDGTKFKVFGLNQFVSTILGQKIDLVLNYVLDINEVAYGNVAGNGRSFSEPYSLVTVHPNNSFNVKLMVYPVWVSDAVGYDLKWFMFNLDRNVFFDVTSLVAFNNTTGPYNPKAYGFLQSKSVSININQVSGAFKTYVHTQVVDIVLKQPPSAAGTPWNVSHESLAGRNNYGEGLHAVKDLGPNSVKLDSGIALYQTWLDSVYGNTYPLFNTQVETSIPVPTHFQVYIGGVMSGEFLMTDWNTVLNLSSAVTLYDTVFIKFIKRTAGGDLQLAMSGMTVTA